MHPVRQNLQAQREDSLSAVLGEVLRRTAALAAMCLSAGMNSIIGYIFKIFIHQDAHKECVRGGEKAADLSPSGGCGWLQLSRKAGLLLRKFTRAYRFAFSVT
jgi:hypothetical protein